MVAAAQSSPTRSKNKAIAGLLGLLAGVFGMHRLYLGQRFWWVFPAVALPLLGHALRQPEWFREPTFFAFALLTLIAWVQTLIICLTPAARFNERFNGIESDELPGGAIAVLIAVVTLMVSTTLMMSVLSIALESYFRAAGS